ncbi:hypothetical protein LVJ94_41045 [Pendulispora rubella]|uniref:Uncharacterized protein n=1 Tax=Pendulispora rubella TaxID=2741070 RepID=A0ABZ2KX51_9BACT
MQFGFKWTALLVLVGVAGSMACGSSESGAAPDRVSDSLGQSEQASHEALASGARAATTDDADPTCGELGQPCCDGWSCTIGARCNASGVCDTPCGLRGESCCRDATGVGHCYDGSTCAPFPPPAHCQ